MQDESEIHSRKSMIRDNSFIQGIRLPVNNGPWAALYIGGIHSGGVALLFASGLSWPLQLLCCVAILLHGGYWLVRLTPRWSRELPCELLLTPTGDWWLRDADGNSRRAQLQADAFISPLLLVLRFQTGTDKRHAFIHADRYNTAMLRRLRVRLLHEVNGEL